MSNGTLNPTASYCTIPYGVSVTVWSHLIFRVTTCLENLEMSGNLTAVRDFTEDMASASQYGHTLSFHTFWARNFSQILTNHNSYWFHSVSMWHTPKIGLTANKLSVKQNISRDVTDFKSDFKSDGFRHFFTNPNLSGLQTRFVSNSDLIFVLKFRKINCCLLTV